MKFKVGDKVRIIPLEKVLSICELRRTIDGVSYYRKKDKKGLKHEIEKTINLRTDMNLGEIVTIREILHYEYSVRENTFFYVDWMLEKTTNDYLEIE